MKDDKWKATTRNKIATPKEDFIVSTLKASGAPAQIAATNTDRGGKNGRITLQIRGKNL